MPARPTPIDPEHPQADLLEKAAAILRRGLLVAYPTETFYGLACDPRDPAAVERIFEAKGRPAKMALPLVAGDTRDVQGAVALFPPTARRLAEAFWPGPLTLVLGAAPDLPPRLLGGGATVGIRVSSHPVARGLARAFGGPIVATSANRTGASPPIDAAEVMAALGDDVALVLDGGRTRGGQASTLVDLTVDPPRVVRSGAVAIAALEAALGRRLA